MGTLKTWLRHHPVTVESLHDAYESSDPEQGDWRHYRWDLRLVWQDGAMSRRSPEFAYRAGLAHDPNKVPSVESVLDSLVLDASAYDGATGFEDFCRTYGYDTDSRRALAIYEACRTTLGWLTDLVGGQREMQVLMYKTDRL